VSESKRIFGDGGSAEEHDEDEDARKHECSKVRPCASTKCAIKCGEDVTSRVRKLRGSSMSKAG
jgi:hypothetical protein